MAGVKATLVQSGEERERCGCPSWQLLAGQRWMWHCGRRCSPAATRQRRDDMGCPVPWRGGGSFGQGCRGGARETAGPFPLGDGEVARSVIPARDTTVLISCVRACAVRGQVGSWPHWPAHEEASSSCLVQLVGGARVCVRVELVILPGGQGRRGPARPHGPAASQRALVSRILSRRSQANRRRFALAPTDASLLPTGCSLDRDASRTPELLAMID
jgi:hypothetical protein